MWGRKHLLGGILLLALMAATAWLLLRDQPLAALLLVLGHTDPGYLLLGLGLMFLFVGCEAMCSRLVLRRLGCRVTWRQCLGYSFAGFYVSSITPSATGGQPAQIYYMSRDGIPAAHGALNMMLIAVCYQVTALGYALTAWLALPELRTALGGGLEWLLLYGGGVMLFLTAGMLVMMFLPGPANALTRGVLALLAVVGAVRDREAAEEKRKKQLAAYAAGARCLRGHPELLPMLLLLTAAQLTALFAVPYVVYLAFGLRGEGLPVFLGTQALVTLAVSSLPLPGAVGPAESGFVRAFTPLFGAGLVTPAMLVSRGISFYAFLLISGCVTLAVHLRGSAKRAGAGREKQNLRKHTVSRCKAPPTVVQ